MDTFGTRMRALRNERKISGAELARQLGVQDKRVSNWENDKHEPDHSMLAKICDKLGTHPNYLLGYSQEVSLGSVQSSEVLNSIEARLTSIERSISTIIKG